MTMCHGIIELALIENENGPISSRQISLLQ